MALFGLRVKIREIPDRDDFIGCRIVDCPFPANLFYFDITKNFQGVNKNAGFVDILKFFLAVKIPSCDSVRTMKGIFLDFNGCYLAHDDM